MTWRLADGTLGKPGLTSVETVQRVPWGTIVKGWDSTYGAGEFVYVKGVANAAVGLMATYVSSTGVTALTATSGVALGGAPVGVFISALDANTKFGYLQISGDAVILKTAVKFDPASGNRVYASGTAGRIMQTSVAGRQIVGARFAATATVTSTTSTAVVTLGRPHLKSGTAV